jgi:hypothetical protein
MAESRKKDAFDSKIKEGMERKEHSKSENF